MEFLSGFGENILFQNKRLRMFFVTFALVLALGKSKWNKRGVLDFLWHWVVAFGILFLDVFITYLITYSVTANAFIIQIFAEFFQPVILIIVYTVLFCRKDDWRATLVIAGSFINATTQIVEFCYSCGSLIDSGITGLTIPFLIFTYSLLIAFAFLIRKYSILRYKAISTSGFVLTMVINSVSLVLTFFAQFLAIFRRESNQSLTSAFDARFTGMQAMIYFALFLFVVTSYISIFMMYREREIYVKARLENNMIRATDSQIALTKQNMDYIRKIRHDLKNQFIFVQALLQEGKYEELNDMLSKISSLSVSPYPYIDCGNLEISSILNMESSKAHANGFVLNCVVVVPAKLCAVISNLVDNAMASIKWIGEMAKDSNCLGIFTAHDPDLNLSVIEL